MTWQLRSAGPDDLEAIMNIERASFLNDAWSDEAMLADLRNPQCWYVVAERDGVAGVVEAYAGLFAPEGAHEADIQTIAVAEPARRGGLGRTLMQTLIGEARKRGAQQLFLEVRADKPGAKHLYDSLGFVEIGLRPGYYQPDNVDAITMRLDIPEPRLRPAVGQ
ncbi:ribosomal protein S18-alanine N-acetyltransferase [soil metagenome]